MTYKIEILVVGLVIFLLSCEKQITDPPTNNYPVRPILFNVITTNDSLLLRWSQSPDENFYSYEVYRAYQASLQDSALVYSTTSVTDTSLIITDFDEGTEAYFRVSVENLDGLEAYSDWRTGSSVTFVQTFNSSNSNDLIGVTIFENEEGGYTIYYRSDAYYFGRSGEAALMAIDSRGNELWRNTYGLELEFGEAIQTGDGGYAIIGGADPGFSIIKTDALGNLEWSKSYSAGLYKLHFTICQTADATYAVCARDANDANTLYLLDSSGEIISEKSIQSDYGFLATYSIKGTESDELVMSGYMRDSTGALSLALLNLNANGEKNWGYTYGIGPDWESNKVNLTNDGGIIVAGHSDGSGYLLRVDQFGQQLWLKRIGTNWIFNQAVETIDGGVIATGQQNGFAWPEVNDAVLVRLDEHGNIQWRQDYGGEGDDVGYSVIQSENGGYVLTGFTDGRLSPGDHPAKLLIIKTDHLGHCDSLLAR